MCLSVSWLKRIRLHQRGAADAKELASQHSDTPPVWNPQWKWHDPLKNGCPWSSAANSWDTVPAETNILRSGNRGTVERPLPRTAGLHPSSRLPAKSKFQRCCQERLPSHRLSRSLPQGPRHQASRGCRTAALRACRSNARSHHRRASKISTQCSTSTQLSSLTNSLLGTAVRKEVNLRHFYDGPRPQGCPPPGQRTAI